MNSGTKPAEYCGVLGNLIFNIENNEKAEIKEWRT